jgi:hypothetical protein
MPATRRSYPHAHPVQLPNGKWAQRAFLHMDFDAAGQIEAALFRLQQTFHGPFFAMLVQQAAAETIMLAIRKRFIQNLPNALEMITVKDIGYNRHSKSLKDQLEIVNRRARDTKEMAELEGLHAELQQATLSGRPGAVLEVQKRLQGFRAQMLNSLNRDRSGTEHTPTWSTLSSGKFRARALEVLKALTDLGAMQVNHGENGELTVSFASRNVLDAILTPSAVQYVFRRGATRSPYNVLWRHLEYGTGAFAKDPDAREHANTRWSLPGGYWRLPVGKTPADPRTITLKGSPGLHALRDKAGLMYDTDAMRFAARLGVAILQSLRGTSPVGAQ